jgi:hypothetical protein
VKGPVDDNMSVRPFDWRDLPTLHRFRNNCVFLDSALVLTRGPIFVPTGALLSTLAYATGIYTFVVQDGNAAVPPMFGQASHVAGQVSAQMSYLAPREAVDVAPVVSLVERLLRSVGEGGAHHIIAEVEEQSDALSILRQAHFGIYARQRIWQLDGNSKGGSLPKGWRSAGKHDEAAIRFLYANLVPGLVQQVEALPDGRVRGLVYYRGTEMLAFVDLEYGLSGILAHPFIHPDAEDVAGTLAELLRSIPDFYSRPVFVRVRSYQSWLERVLEKHDAQLKLVQAVMVRHLAVKQRVTQSLKVPVMNGSTPEPTVPVAQIKTE